MFLVTTPVHNFFSVVVHAEIINYQQSILLNVILNKNIELEKKRDPLQSSCFFPFKLHLRDLTGKDITSIFKLGRKK